MQDVDFGGASLTSTMCLTLERFALDMSVALLLVYCGGATEDAHQSGRVSSIGRWDVLTAGSQRVDCRKQESEE